MSSKFEYKTVIIGIGATVYKASVQHEVDEMLKTHGDDGWRLVSVVPIRDEAMDRQEVFHYFVREQESAIL